MDKAQAAEFNRRNIEEFRATGGRMSAFGDAPVLLLTTVGAKSGQARTSPMMYLPDEIDCDTVYVFASAAGSDRNPSWFHNLVAHPDDVIIEIDRRRVAAHATVLAEPDRARVYAKQASLYQGFAAYQRQTARRIPVVELTFEPPSQQGRA